MKAKCYLEAKKILSSRVKQVIFWLVVITSVVVFYQLIARTQTGKVQELALSDAVSRIKKGEIQDVVQRPTQFDLTDKSGNKYYAKIESANDAFKNTILTTAIDNGVNVKSEEGTGGYFWTFVIGYLPILLFIGFWIFMFRQMQAGGNKALSFGKSRAKLLNNQQKRVTFKDVAGVEEAKD